MLERALATSLGNKTIFLPLAFAVHLLFETPTKWAKCSHGHDTMSKSVSGTGLAYDGIADVFPESPLANTVLRGSAHRGVL